MWYVRCVYACMCKLFYIAPFGITSCFALIHIIFIHTGLLTTNTAASLEQLGVKCLIQGPLDSDSLESGELLFYFPCTQKLKLTAL